MAFLKALFLATVSSLLALANASVCYTTNDAPVHGDATYYSWAADAAAGEGACGYDVSETGMEIAAIDPTLWAGSESCGMCIQITGPTGDTLDVMVVDQCMTCTPGSLDLSKEGFMAIAGGRKGMVPITWREIECPVSDKGVSFIFVYANKKAGMPFQMRMFNHRHRIRKVERLYESEGPAAKWFKLPRGRTGNFGVPKKKRGMSKPFKMRLTSDVTGEVIVDRFKTKPQNKQGRRVFTGKQQFTSVCNGNK